jgi:hypothetical protein
MAVHKLRRYFALGTLVIALAAFGAGCGSSSGSGSGGSAGSGTTTGTTHFAKTKFVLHAGLAFGAFHRWIYKPLKKGDLQHPFSHKLTTLKAVAAAGFTYHELKLALADAQADPKLSRVVAPITALENKVKGLGSGLKSGNVDTSQIDSANGSIGSIHSDAASAGQPITEQTPSAP